MRQKYYSPHIADQFPDPTTATTVHRSINGELIYLPETGSDSGSRKTYTDRHANVSHKFVGNMRSSVNGTQIAEPRKVERGGTVYTQNTENIGRREALVNERISGYPEDR